jgi:hypothetical protein
MLLLSSCKPPARPVCPGEREAVHAGRPPWLPHPRSMSELHPAPSSSEAAARTGPQNLDRVVLPCTATCSRSTLCAASTPCPPHGSHSPSLRRHTPSRRQEPLPPRMTALTTRRRGREALPSSAAVRDLLGHVLRRRQEGREGRRGRPQRRLGLVLRCCPTDTKRHNLEYCYYFSFKSRYGRCDLSFANCKLVCG